MNLKGAFYVAVITVGLDYIFHLTFTSPMEVPFYFIAKFIVALAVAYFLVDRIGAIKSAVLFTLFFDAYYFVGVLLLSLSYLSSSPTQIISIDGIMSPILLAVLWTVFHGAFFYAGAIFARIYEKK